MKFANIALALGIGLYFSVATDALFWSDFYYTVLIGFCAVCLFQNNKNTIDKYFGGLIISLIWILYQSKPFIDLVIFPWIRFSTGILFVLLGIIYTIRCIIKKIQHDN